MNQRQTFLQVKVAKNPSNGNPENNTTVKVEFASEKNCLP
jgi:hypothetical protein